MRQTRVQGELYGSEATVELELALPVAVESAYGINELLRDDFFSSEGFHRIKSFESQLAFEKKDPESGEKKKTNLSRDTICHGHCPAIRERITRSVAQPHVAIQK